MDASQKDRGKPPRPPPPVYGDEFNVYYRFVHLVSDRRIMQMPAILRMNVIANQRHRQD